MLTARFPAEPNRFFDSGAAVTPGASVLINQAAPVELAMVVCGVQALAALSLLRQTQRSAFDAMRILRSAELPDAHELTERMSGLRNLQLDLSFGVEAYLQQRLLVPSLPVEQLHAALVEGLALPEGARVTATMLERITSALEVEAGALATKAREAADAARVQSLAAAQRAEKHAIRRRQAAVVAGGFVGLLALPLGFLGADVREVDGTRSIVDPAYWPYYLVMAILVGLVTLAAWVYVQREEKSGG